MSRDYMKPLPKRVVARMKARRELRCLARRAEESLIRAAVRCVRAKNALAKFDRGDTYFKRPRPRTRTK